MRQLCIGYLYTLSGSDCLLQLQSRHFPGRNRVDALRAMRSRDILDIVGGVVLHGLLRWFLPKWPWSKQLCRVRARSNVIEHWCVPVDYLRRLFSRVVLNRWGWRMHELRSRKYRWKPRCFELRRLYRRHLLCFRGEFLHFMQSWHVPGGRRSFVVCILQLWGILRLGCERMLELHRRDVPGVDGVEELHTVRNWAILVGYGSVGVLDMRWMSNGRIIFDRREFLYHLLTRKFRLNPGFVTMRGMSSRHVLIGWGLGMRQLFSRHLPKRPGRIAVRAMRSGHLCELRGCDKLIAML